MSKAIRPHAIRELLGTSGPLDRLRRAAGRHSRDTGELSALLPTALAQRVTLVREDAELLILAENNAVAQLARFHAPALQQQAGVPVRVRVSPHATAPRRPAPPPPELPAEAAGCLRQAADGIDDPELAASLRRLAGRAED